MKLVSVTLLVASIFNGAFAAAAPTMLEDAIGAYQAALDQQEPDARLAGFRRAHQLFAQVIEEQDVRNAQLYVNAGNAAMQGELVGPAIHAFRCALEIDPDHEQALRNLDHARELLPSWVPRPAGRSLLDSFFFFYRLLAPAARVLLAAVCFGVAALLVAVAIGWRRPWARNLAIVPAVIWLGFAGTDLWRWWFPADDDVVVVAVEALARSADSNGAQPRFAHPLPGGTEARVVERREGWIRIRLADDRDGWIRASTVKTVGL
ncbi:MAG: hypothetical protein CMJ18_11790 [Phycisphaeraceae bacterium]|nr:hypothetical protein [Phycisphaeraceae bacterium]